MEEKALNIVWFSALVYFTTNSFPRSQTEEISHAGRAATATGSGLY